MAPVFARGFFTSHGIDKLNFFRTVSLGIKYMDIWPQEPTLGAIFPENRFKYVMGVAKVLIPPFIVFIFLWVYIQGGGLKGVSFLYTMETNWPVTIVCILFLLIIPLQGYYWFGKRAQLKLNGKQKIFYKGLCEKLKKEPASDPTMFDFAKAVAEGCKKLNKDFLDAL